MTYEVFEDKVNAGDWRVEGLDIQTGDVAIAIFSGVQSRERAYLYFNLVTREK